jgi:hypothetical protein
VKEERPFQDIFFSLLTSTLKTQVASSSEILVINSSSLNFASPLKIVIAFGILLEDYTMSFSRRLQPGHGRENF